VCAAFLLCDEFLISRAKQALASKVTIGVVHQRRVWALASDKYGMVEKQVAILLNIDEMQ
jgi:hypothetical protein